MTLDVETVVAVSLMMAVFSAVAAVGTSIVLGAGFERLRSGFEIVRKQTGFFSDAINKLEHKVEIVDKQATNFTHSITTLESKVQNVGEQASAFTACVQKLEQKVEIVDKQTGFFSDALYKLEKKIEAVDTHAGVPTETDQDADIAGLISASKDEAATSGDLLVASLENYSIPPEQLEGRHLNMSSFLNMSGDMKDIRFH